MKTTHTPPLLPRHRLSVTGLQARQLSVPAKKIEEPKQTLEPSYCALYRAFKDSLWQIC